jgi:hypothetical protein
MVGTNFEGKKKHIYVSLIPKANKQIKSKEIMASLMSWGHTSINKQP